MALPRDAVDIASVQPRVITDVASHLIEFLIDTGATFSVLTQRIGHLSNHKEYVMGLSGKKQGHSFLEPVLCSANGQLFLHSFLFVSDCPIPLMGRDLLTKLGAAGKLHSSKYPVVKTPLQVLPTILHRIKNFLPLRKEWTLRLISSQPIPVSSRSQEFLAPVT